MSPPACHKPLTRYCMYMRATWSVMDVKENASTESKGVRGQEEGIAVGDGMVDVPTRGRWEAWHYVACATSPLEVGELIGEVPMGWTVEVDDLGALDYPLDIDQGVGRVSQMELVVASEPGTDLGGRLIIRKIVVYPLDGIADDLEMLPSEPRQTISLTCVRSSWVPWRIWGSFW